MVRKRKPSIAATAPQKEVSFLRTHWLKVKNRRALTDAFNLEFNHDYTVFQIRGVLRKHKITSGRSGRFTLRHIPWSVQEKGTGRVKRNSGSFAKGCTPVNMKPLYSERINTKGYIEIKVPAKNPYTGAKTRYMQKHVWLWEQHYGQTKKGCCIVFLDGNRLNCVLSNLAELGKAENLNRNRRKSNRAHNMRFRETTELLYKLQCAAKKAKKEV